MTSNNKPASSGMPGPGERMILSYFSNSSSSNLSLRSTSTSAPSSFYQMGKVVGERVVVVYDYCFHDFIYNLQFTKYIFFSTIYKVQFGCAMYAAWQIVLCTLYIVHEFTFSPPLRLPFFSAPSLLFTSCNSYSSLLLATMPPPA